MKAFVISEPMVGRITDMPIPVPREDELLIEVIAAGLCGTDIHIYKGEYYGGYPRVPGHEFSGVVVEADRNVTRFKVGQAVAAETNIISETYAPCKANRQNFCENMQAVGVSQDGAMAQYVLVPERCVFDITGMSFLEGALVEPLACVVHGQQCAGVPLGSSVLVLGAGPIGLMHAQLAAVNGAASVTVTDIVPDKLALAKQLGADRTFLSHELADAGVEHAFDLVIDCTGIPRVVEGAVRYVKDGGTLLFFGVCPPDSKISVSPYEIYKREVRFLGTFALKKTFGQAVQLARSGKINLRDLVDQRLTLDDAPAAFAERVEGNVGLKTVFYPNGLVD